MIPKLFSAGETDFSTNGLGRLTDCISCTVTEERNGIYECVFEYPFFGRFYHDMHDNGGVVVCIHDDKHDEQPFDIYSYSAPIDGIVTFYAHHISYRLGRIVLQPFEAISCSDAISKLKTKSANTNPFTFWTDKVTSANFKLEQPEVIRAILGGQAGSILDVFGTGEYEFDNFTVKLHADRGVDHGVTIRYGKNLINIRDTRDESGSYNAIAPYWKGESATVYLPEIYIMASGQSGSPYVIARDFTSEFSEAPTEQQLRDKAQTYMANNKPWTAEQNIVIDFTQLWQTPEYESVASLQRVGLCDYVSVYYPELGIVQEQQKVVKVVYNVLEERFDEVELGELRASLAGTIANSVSQQVETQMADFGSMMQGRINAATGWITGGLGGYVMFTRNANGQPEEILILDRPDVSTAVNVIRINKNGIGFSTNGYQGPYTTAWTIDGHFNADFITAGSINANLITAGTINADLITSGTMSADRISGGAISGIELISIGSAYMGSSYYNIFERLRSGGWEWWRGGETYLTAQTLAYAISVGRYTRASSPSSTNIQLMSGYKMTFHGYIGRGGFEFTLNSANNYLTPTWNPDDEISVLEIGYSRYSEVPATNASIIIDNNRQMLFPVYTASNNSRPGIYFNNMHSSGGSYLAGLSAYSAGDTSHANGVKIHGVLYADSITTPGGKSREVGTEDFGKRLLYCYEMPNPVFGDIGEGVIDDDGKAYIFLDTVFAETITKTGYQVFLQKYGDGDCWISERHPDFFVVEGTPELAFGWELKAKQKDLDQRRLENSAGFLEIESTDYGELSSQYIYELYEGRYST